ncbi:antibiotic biosynthesis monooxygenase family protein [Nocardia sp. NPDC056100]|uniref:antibiotic biosynthesis monooxygenase family protein n=1 Tax=Nocardia sp. NPDC056100 TaxID=3345712 RepID=UPI0035DD6B61
MTDTEVTSIDFFDPGTALDALIGDWRDLGEYLSTTPGFRAARLHRALEPDTRFTVTDYTLWDSAETAAGALDHPRREAWLDRLGDGIHRGTAVYRTVHDIGPATEREFDGPGVTFMNVFEIAPDAADAFAVGWDTRARFMSTAPGFRHARLHRALDATATFQLVNIAHWDTVAQWRDALDRPTMVAARAQARTVATANPAVYELIAEILGPAA